MTTIDKIAESIEEKLSYTNGWRIPETQYTEHCYEIAENVVKLFAIPVVSNWLACKDELPKHGETVLTYTPLTEMASEQVRLMKYGTLKSGFPAGITHWQRIDKPTCY